MDFDRLRYFCTVAQTGNIHRASELLRLTPAALSKSIKLLESELGIRLTVPVGRGIAITDEGKEFAEKAKIVLEDVMALQESLRPHPEHRKSLKIGSFEVFTTHFLGPLVRDYLLDFDLSLYELGPGRLEDALLSGLVEIGITYLPIRKEDPRPIDACHAA